MRRWPLLVVITAACGVPEESRVEQAVQKCPNGVIEGIDVFTGNGTIDWAKVQGAGRQFAFIKATQGDYNVQSTFRTNWAQAHTAGVITSPYHFFDGTNDGVAQANAFLAEVTAAGGLQPGDLPALLDIECPTSSTQGAAQSNCEHTGDSGWVATPLLITRIFDWLDTVTAATGRKPLIYSYPSWFAAVGFTDARLADYPLFIASYNACATIPAPWTDAVFWQYSASGTVAGVPGQVDMDRYFGTLDDLKGFTIQPPAGADAGVTPDADGPMPDPPAGCGCHGGISPGFLGVAAFVMLLVFRRRSVRPRRRRK